MKKIILFFIATMLITIGIPSLFVLKTGVYRKPLPEEEAQISVYIKSEDRILKTTRAEYLAGVVAAEMPASFETEALKAQTVAARSYLLSRLRAYKASAPPPEHKGADICTDPAHCAAWVSIDEKRAVWGSDADMLSAKIRDAVRATSDEAVTYSGEIISAVFHSTSSGKTENSRDVWGGDRAYLVSVSSPGEEDAPHFKSELTLSRDEFCRIAAESFDGVDFANGLIGDICRSDAGGIITIEIGGVCVRGTDFRTAYALRSTNVVLCEQADGTIHFDVTGYGHGVGMSQYGANAMAKRGALYDEILKHYYSGVEIEKINSI